MTEVWFEMIPPDRGDIFEHLQVLIKDCEGKLSARNLYKFKNWQSAMSFVAFAKQDLEEKFGYSTQIKITIPKT